MNIPMGRSETTYTFSRNEVSFRIVTGPTREQLYGISPRHVKDYEDFKTNYVADS
ncbi:MAG: hypothetical protein ACI9EZ_002234 [Halobacteriales archaeon]|jgi:hypothetical protein